jgi:hypothetical protein
VLAEKAANADLVRPPLPLELTPGQRDALVASANVGLEPAVRRQAHKTLHPLFAPIRRPVAHFGSSSAHDLQSAKSSFRPCGNLVQPTVHGMSRRGQPSPAQPVSTP